MNRLPLQITAIGGPTALIEAGGLRLLTDPTFDPAPQEYRAAAYALHKTQSPAIDAESLGPIDVVLLSHDHHFDNLDTAGRVVLAKAGRVLTTCAGAERIGGETIGMDVWQTIEVQAPDDRVLRITATPARHGPPQADRGPVIGFVLAFADEPESAVYISGDTVWYEGVAEVGRRYLVKLAVLFAGAAKVDAVGPWHLTFTAEETVEVARAFANATIVPLHVDGWAHFTESRADIDRAFADADLTQRLHWLEPGVPERFTDL